MSFINDKFHICFILDRYLAMPADLGLITLYLELNCHFQFQKCNWNWCFVFKSNWNQ